MLLTNDEDCHSVEQSSDVRHNPQQQTTLAHTNNKQPLTQNILRVWRLHLLFEWNKWISCSRYESVCTVHSLVY